MKPLNLELNELDAYRKKESVKYAYCGETKRELWLTFNGEMIIKKDKKEVGRTIFQQEAIKLFNEL